MNDALAHLILQEEAKLALYEERVRVCKERIAVLRGLASQGEDELDSVAAKVTQSSRALQVPPRQETVYENERPRDAAAESTPTSPHPSVEHDESRNDLVARPRRRPSDGVVEILRFIQTPRTLEAVLEHLKGLGLSMSNGAVSNVLYSYKKLYNFVELSPEGFHALTEQGNAFLTTLASENTKTPGAVASAPGAISTQVSDLIPSGGSDREGGC